MTLKHLAIDLLVTVAIMAVAYFAIVLTADSLRGILRDRALDREEECVTIIERTGALLQVMGAECALPSHNAAGGYIAACGALPGMVGDDC